jgi:serine/threonine-protein kinase
MSELGARLAAGLAGRYRLDREIGRGGTASVFLADDRRHLRRVAIKLLDPDLGRRVGAERFLQEIEVAARLTHPHILPVFDSGEADGLLFYVMPYLAGDSLRQWLVRDRRLAVDAALRIAADVAAALDYAHRSGIVHRDIKPENIMFADGLAVVADFGIARALDRPDSLQLTRTGTIIGTPAYMSPEQATGGDVGPASDVYSLGCVVYEMLAGDAPHRGRTMTEIVTGKLTVDPLPLATVRPEVSGAVSAAVARALARTPGERFARAGDFQRALIDPSAPAALMGPAAPSRDEGERSVGVLPFVNTSGEPDNEYFSDGVTDEIINALSSVEGLRVAARTSAFAFKGRAADVRTIGEQLDVATVLEGSVRKAGNRIRLTAQLIKAADGFQLWSGKFDRELTDVFDVQEELAQAIADLLIPRLGGPGTTAEARGAMPRDAAAPTMMTGVPSMPPPLVKPGTRDLEAYTLYLKGRYCWNRRTVEGMEKAIAYFDAALARDPDYAPAHAGRAECYSLLGWIAFGAMPPRVAFPEAEAAALKAIALDPTLADARNALAWSRLVYDWDWPAAEREFRLALEVDPRFALAHSWYGLSLALRGRGPEAIDEARVAMRLDPLAPVLNTLAGWVYYFLRRYEESIDEYRRALELDPAYSRAHLGIGWAFEQLGLYDEAIASFDRAAPHSGNRARLAASLGHAHAAAGRHERAAACLDELLSLSRSRYVPPSFVALVYAGLGDAERAFDWLGRAFDERSGALATLGAEPQFDSLRADPRFDVLMTRVGLS